MPVTALHPFLQPKLGEAFSNPAEGILGQFLTALSIPWLQYRKVASALLLLPHRFSHIICTISSSPLPLCVLLPLLGTLQVTLSYLKSIPAERLSATPKEVNVAYTCGIIIVTITIMPELRRQGN